MAKRKVEAITVGELLPEGEGYVGDEALYIFPGIGMFVDERAALYPSAMGKNDLRLYRNSEGAWGIDGTKSSERSFPESSPDKVPTEVLVGLAYVSL